MAEADRIQPISLEMIRTLIGMPTVSRDSNLDLIAYVQDYLKGFGIDSTLVHDETGKKANLYATIGPKDKGGICLSGHTDVVPIDGQDWHTDPFQVVEKDGLLYGRGTSDMKSFIAIALAFVPEFLAKPLKTPIHFAFSYDEEVGCIGVRRLLEILEKQPVKPAACIVGEPTSMKPVVAHKGKKSTRCHVHGLECHSSLAPTGVNAVEFAAEIVTYLRGMARRKRTEGPFDPGFDPPHTTVHTGLMHGGTALNIVPKDCYFDFEFRHLPEDDPEELLGEVREFVETKLLPEMHAIDPATGVRFEQISQIPGLDMKDDDPLTQLVMALSGANSTGKVAFGTEAGLFQQVGIPTIVCGPGDIAQAHKPNEFIALSQVAQGEAFMRRLLDRVRA
ncbi:MAG: acetylornithine deacetylase [Oceanibaculum sp.]